MLFLDLAWEQCRRIDVRPVKKASVGGLSFSHRVLTWLTNCIDIRHEPLGRLEVRLVGKKRRQGQRRAFRGGSSWAFHNLYMRTHDIS